MNISSRCEYGYRAVLELASHGYAGESLTVEAIAERRHIPHKFLVHILLQLKRAGIVRSIRGAKGGYLLARPPETISLLDIIVAIDGPVLGTLPASDEHSADFAIAWRDVAQEIGKIFEGTSIRDVLEKSRQISMYNI